MDAASRLRVYHANVLALEDEHFVGCSCRERDVVHSATMRTFHKLCIGQSARIHAGPAQKYLAPSHGDALQHALDIVESVRGLLFGLGRKDGIGHQEDGHLSGGVALDEGVGQAQGIVDTLGAIGWVIDDEQGMHDSRA